MPIEELFALARVATVAQILERDDFARRFAAREPISVLELLYPLLQGYDSVGDRRRRRARRHRPDVQPAARPRRPARLRQARAGRADDADPAGHRRRREDVEVARQPHRRHRAARGDVRQDAVGPRRGDGRSGTRCCWAPSRRPASGRATPSARWPGRWSRASTTRPRRPPPRSTSTASSSRHEAPEDMRGGRGRRRRAVHLPALLADAFGVSRSDARRQLAQGGVKLDGEVLGRRRRRRPSALDGRGAAARQAPLRARARRRVTRPRRPAALLHRRRRRRRRPHRGRAAVVRQSGVRGRRDRRLRPGRDGRRDHDGVRARRVADLQALLDALIPPRRGREHNALNHDTQRARARAGGADRAVGVGAGRRRPSLALGTWQQIVLVDFDDRPRDRQVTVQVLVLGVAGGPRGRLRMAAGGCYLSAPLGTSFPPSAPRRQRSPRRSGPRGAGL